MSTAARDSTDRFVGGLENFSSEFVADGSINGGDAVKLSSDNQVTQSDTDGEPAVGIAMYDVADGEPVTVALVGAMVRANAATGLAADEPVTSHGGTSAGQVDTGDTTGDAVFGQCIIGESGGEAVILITGLGGDQN